MSTNPDIVVMRPPAYHAIKERIAPILHETYGKGDMVDALIEYLSDRIATGNIGAYLPYGGDRGREFQIMRVCWDWFAGGTTAESTARKIEEALTPKETEFKSEYDA